MTLILEILLPIAWSEAQGLFTAKSFWGIEIIKRGVIKKKWCLSGTWENHELVAIYRVGGWEKRKIMGWIGRGIEIARIIIEIVV
jgi:hypothetical protein